MEGDMPLFIDAAFFTFCRGSKIIENIMELELADTLHILLYTQLKNKHHNNHS